MKIVLQALQTDLTNIVDRPLEDIKLKPCQTALPTVNSVTERWVIVLFGAEGVVTAALEQACTGRPPSCQAAPRDYTVEEN